MSKLQPNTTEEKIELIRAVADGREVYECNLYTTEDTPIFYISSDAAAGCWFFDLIHYTIRPRTIRIGEYDVPVGLKVAPEIGVEIWVASPAYRELHSCFLWHPSEYANILLKRGLLHDNKEAAELHGKALASLTGVIYE